MTKPAHTNWMEATAWNAKGAKLEVTADVATAIAATFWLVPCEQRQECIARLLRIDAKLIEIEAAEAAKAQPTTAP